MQPPGDVQSTAKTMWLSAHLPKHVPKIEYADKLCTAKRNSRQRVKNICVVTGFNGLMWSCRWFNYLLHRLYSVETLLCVCGFESELAVKRHVTETQSGPVPGESAKLNVLSYFSMTVAVWNSLMVSLSWWTPGAILKRPNPFPVNHKYESCQARIRGGVWVHTYMVGM